jgi:hypothetical protein
MSIIENRIFNVLLNGDTQPFTYISSTGKEIEISIDVTLSTYNMNLLGIISAIGKRVIGLQPLIFINQKIDIVQSILVSVV